MPNNILYFNMSKVVNRFWYHLFHVGIGSSILLSESIPIPKKLLLVIDTHHLETKEYGKFQTKNILTTNLHTNILLTISDINKLHPCKLLKLKKYFMLLLSAQIQSWGMAFLNQTEEDRFFEEGRVK